MTKVEQEKQKANYPIYQEYIDKFIALFLLPAEEGALERRDILKEWKLARIGRIPSILVTSNNSAVTQFFTPLYIPLKTNVRVRIVFGSQEILQTFNVPTDMEGKFQQLADKYLLQYVRYSKDNNGLEMSDDLGDVDFEVQLPWHWSPRAGYDPTTVLFLQLKELIKESVVIVDANR